MDPDIPPIIEQEYSTSKSRQLAVARLQRPHAGALILDERQPISPRSRQQRGAKIKTPGIDVFLTLLRQLGTLGLAKSMQELGLCSSEISMLDMARRDLGWTTIQDHVAKGEITAALCSDFDVEEPEERVWTYAELLEKLPNLILVHKQLRFFSRLQFSRDSKIPEGQ
jgi:hypothetical protein